MLSQTTAPNEETKRCNLTENKLLAIAKEIQNANPDLFSRGIYGYRKPSKTNNNQESWFIGYDNRFNSKSFNRECVRLIILNFDNSLTNSQVNQVYRYLFTLCYYTNQPL